MGPPTPRRWWRVAAAIQLQGSPGSSPTTVKNYLVNNATTGRLTGIGSGSPNRLLYAPPGGTETDNPPVANFTYSCSGRTCTFTSTSTDDFGTWGAAGIGTTSTVAAATGCTLSHTFPRPGATASPLP